MNPGRPATTAADAGRRQSAWDKAVRYSGLKQEETADVLGVSVATVSSYGSRTGNVPSQVAIDALKAHNLDRALETLAERYGGEAVRRIGGRL
ncbi:hypothetical protein COL154_014417, partial [Colletotrichum chrysophilum]